MSICFGDIEIINREEVKSILSIGASTIDRWEKSGDFPKRIYFSKSKIGWNKKEIEEWLKEKTSR